MKNEWLRGYGQRYRHLVSKVEITKHYKRTWFACGKQSEMILDGFSAVNAPKCPHCLSIERETQ
jgi:hypothetical protein